MLIAACAGALAAADAAPARGASVVEGPPPADLPPGPPPTRADPELDVRLDQIVRGLPDPSCLVVEVDGHRYEHHADVPLVPASAQKLHTAVAALEILGADHRFTTAAAVTGSVADGVLHGDLVVVGGGDPVLTTPGYDSRYPARPVPATPLAELADEIAATGLTTVAGRVVADAGRYDDEWYQGSWPTAFRTQGFIGPVGALVVDDGYETWSTTALRPVTPADDPAVAALASLVTLLRDRGVTVTGDIGRGTAPEGAVPIAWVQSPPLGQIVEAMLRESDNDTAEMLLKEMGRVAAGRGGFTPGAKAVSDVLAGVGVLEDGSVVADGSGLSRDGRTTCRDLVAALVHPGTAEVVKRGLAVAGESGTLSRRFRDSPVKGRLRAKTGTLRGVSSLVGEVDRADGSVARFALVVNTPDGAAVPASVLDLERRLAELLAGVAPRLIGPGRAL